MGKLPIFPCSVPLIFSYILVVLLRRSQAVRGSFVVNLGFTITSLYLLFNENTSVCTQARKLPGDQ